MNRTHALLGGGAICVATLLWLGLRPGDPEPISNDESSVAAQVLGDASEDEQRLAQEMEESVADPCDFRPGDKHTYRFRLDSAYMVYPNAVLAGAASVGSASASAGERYTGTTTVEASFFVAASMPDGTTYVGVRLHDPDSLVNGQSMTGELPADLGELPYLVEMGPHCEVRNFGHRAGASPEAQLMARGIVDHLIVRGPHEASERGYYDVVENDPLGRVSVRYRYSPARPGHPRSAVRERRGYALTGAAGPTGTTTDILGTRREIDWGPEAFYRGYSGREVSRESVGAATLAEIEEESIVTSIAEREGAFTGEDMNPRAFEWTRTHVDPGSQAAGVWTGRPIEDALAEVARLQAQGTRRGNWEALNLLRDYLRDNPSMADVLASRIRGGEFENLDSAVYAHALARASTDESRDALVDIAYDTSASEIARTQAAAALGTVENPTVELVDQLAELASNTDGLGSEHGLANSAAGLSIGVINHDNEFVRPEVREATRRVIGEMLESADEGAARRAALAIVGNTGDEFFLDAIERGLASGDPETQQAAAHAGRRMESQATDEMFASRLSIERDARTIASMADAQRVQVGEQDAEPGGSTVEAYVRLLHNSSDIAAKTAVIHLLGSICDTNATARDGLIVAFRLETSQQLKGIISRYIPGDELLGLE